jgi:hypothetical protein
MDQNSDKINRDGIMSALARLNELLAVKGVIGELCIFGDAAMLLAFDARESTRDVDAIFVPKGEVLSCARQVADEMEIDQDWLNDGVKAFVSDRGEVTSEGMPIFSHLRIMRPITEYLLAMKCLASRVAGYGYEGDRRDVKTLLKRLKITDASAVCDLVTLYYKESLLPPKMRYFIEETLSELQSEI